MSDEEVAMIDKEDFDEISISREDLIQSALYHAEHQKCLAECKIRRYTRQLKELKAKNA